MSPEVSNCLDVIQEECAEMIKVISKIKRFGITNSHPKNQKIPNIVLLAEEYGDLLGAMDKLEDLLQDYWVQYEASKATNFTRRNKPGRIDHFFALTEALSED